jgi:signal transduction histidine kinase/CheY-like chemotaxis protein
MLKEIFSEYALSELLEQNGAGLAVADKNKKIIWFNKKFKQNSGIEKLKGRGIDSILKSINPSYPNKFNSKKTEEIILPLLDNNLKIIPLKSRDKVDGFILKLEKVKGKIQLHVDESPQKNLLFQKEFQHILILLVKEKSLNVLSRAILESCVKISGSKLGVIVFLEENKKYEFIFEDPDRYLKNETDIKKEISHNYSFIIKWLSINKRSLPALNKPNNIGFNLTRVLKSDALIISPCFFNNELLATIIVGGKESYGSYEINHIEQFSALLSFAISSIRTRELNAALESRLLQSQKLETIGKLSSGMAHDFSNLLSSIFGSLNLLKKRIPESESIYRLLDNIENCSVRAKDLTKGLLSYGKPTPKRKELIKPNLLLTEMSKVINQTFPKKITLQANIEEKLYDILGNGTEIYQVLLNLCVNAKEAIEDQGTITLSAKNITVNENNMINYPLLDKGNYVNFTVKDTGSGIDDENIQKIFDPYFSTKLKETGSGLGLYVTYGIIKAHKGHIEVSSAVGEGTAFDVFIPAFEPSRVEKSSSAEKIILLADDEIMLRDLLAELLESNNYNVIKVATGVETLKVLTEEIKVDLVIMDYSMPEMNGIDCVKQIRKLKFNMPIILSTGSLSIDEKFNPKKIGINSFLSKPYEFDTMLATIQHLI